MQGKQVLYQLSISPARSESLQWLSDPPSPQLSTLVFPQADLEVLILLPQPGSAGIMGTNCHVSSSFYSQPPSLDQEIGVCGCCCLSLKISNMVSARPWASLRLRHSGAEENIMVFALEDPR